MRKIDYSNPDCVLNHCDSVSDSDSTAEATHLNCFDDEFITHGSVNGIPTSLVVDSGAKISIMSTDFVNDTMTPVCHQNIFGISQVSISAPVYEVPVVLPTLNGLCRLAVDSRLPAKTVLIGIDFGKENVLSLLHHVKSDPLPVMTTTRAMSADNALATQIAEALHSSKGATPLSLSDIPDTIEPELEETTDPTPAAAELSSSSRDSCSLVPITMPTLSFDGITKDKFKKLQSTDPSLAPLWELAKKHEKSFFIVNGLLMCLTSTQNHFSHAIIVPQSLRKKVLVAAHEGLGHGGLNTTRSLINRHFSWPNMAADIKAHVLSCPKCVKFNKSGAPKVPMLEPEIVSERCEKLAMDIVGPLPKSKNNLRFIFTCMELASGFPFAIALKTYTADETAKALLSVISILGAPLHVLSDQGSNFLSVTLTKLEEKFGIGGIKTSPYHPQSNGRLERFHSTLKNMLSKCIDNKQDWPVALELVLYFARNFPHSRHGFTPHELLFLKPSPYILSTLKSLWSSDSQSSINLPQFIHDIDSMFACQNHFVKKSLSSKHASSRVSKESKLVVDFKVGDVVYKRCPGINKCLEASWDGPFTIAKVVPPVNCSIVPQGKKTKPKVVHLSMLKKATPVMRTLIVPEEVDNEFVPLPNNSTVKIALTMQQQQQLDFILSSFPSVFSDTPGLTSLVSHSITVTSTTPVWSPSYSVPLAYQEAFREEIENLLALGIIEPSSSAWTSSPMPVKKKDGGIRLVVDYRKLNSITVHNPFSMPSIDDILAHLGSATFLSKLDLLKGFHQVPLSESSKHLTAFTCLQGKFQLCYAFRSYQCPCNFPVADAICSSWLRKFFSPLY